VKARTWSLRLTALGLGLLALAAMTPLPSAGAGADTGSRLNEAKAELATLVKKIQTSRKEAARLEAELAGLELRAAESRGQLGRVQTELVATRQAVSAADEEHQTLRARLNALARDAYMAGPPNVLWAILAPGNLGDLTARVAYINRVGRHQVDLARQVQDFKETLRTKEGNLDGLAQSQVELLAEIDSAWAARQRARTQLNQALRNLADARDRMVILISQLEKQLRDEELARLRRSLRGENIAFGKWAENFLPVLGAPTCRANLVVVVAWQAQEFTKASWNPLATSYSMPGATKYNSHGVRNYVSLEQGLEASRRTLALSSHGYEAILSRLRSCSPSMTTAEAIRDSDWCRGCTEGQYVTGVVPKVERNYEGYADM